MSEKTRRSERMKRQFEPTPEEEKMEPKTKYGVVKTAELLNVRSTPNRTANNIVATIPKGTRFKIVNETANMYKIECVKAMGWVAAQFCEIVEE